MDGGDRPAQWLTLPLKLLENPGAKIADRAQLGTDQRQPPETELHDQKAKTKNKSGAIAEILAIDPLRKFQASVLKFAAAFEQASNTDTHSFLETDVGKALEKMHSSSGDALGSLLNRGKELRGMDDYSFMELLNAEA